MAEKYHDVATVTAALADEEERKKLTAHDFMQMDYVLTDRQHQTGIGDDEKQQLDNHKKDLHKAVNEYVQKLASADMTGLSLKDLQSCTDCLNFFKMNMVDGNVSNFNAVMQKIEAQRAVVKTQTLDNINNNPQNLSPADLWKLRENLNYLPQENATTEAGKKLEDVIVAKAQELAENKTVILDMNQAYVLRDLLQAVEAHPVSDKKEANAPVLKNALEILKDQIETFEEHYGVREPLDEAIVQRNIETLSKMPSAAELFAYNEVESELAPAVNLMDIRGAVHDAAKNGETFSLERLAGVLQDRSLELPQFDTDRKILLEMALKRVKETDASKLQPKDLANFGLLIEKLQKSDKNEDKKTAKLLNQKHEALLAVRRNSRGGVKHPEFASVIGVLDNIKVEGNLTLLGREQTDQITQDSDIALFKERILEETKIFLANTSKEEITEETFKETYNERLKLGIVEIVYADKISKGEIDKKDRDKMLALFDGLSDEAKAGRPIKINQTTFAGWQAVHDNRSNAAVNRTEAAGHEKTAKGFKAGLKAFDARCAKKYPTLYPLLKNALVSSGWGAAYGIGSMFGPAGISVVATASFAYSGYKFFNGFRKARKEAKAEGKKLGFWTYLKSHKLQAAGMVLSATSAAFGLGGMTGLEGLSNGSALQSTFQMARAPAGMALAATGAVNQAAKAFARRGDDDKRSFGRRFWDGTKAFGLSAFSFGVGMYAGRAGSEIGIEAYQNYFGDNAAPAPAPAPAATQNTQDTSPQPQADIPAPVTPAIDVNNLTAEQQHDLKMLFQRDPEDANRLIGDGQWHNSDDLEKMWNATGKNALSDEVKVKLAEFADTRFDEKGHFINSDGSIDTKAENAAKEWQAKYDAAHREPAQTTEPEIRKIEPLSEEDLKLKMPPLDTEIKLPDPEQMQLDIHGGIARSLGVQTIERLDNGNIVTERTSPGGRHYTSEISPDAKFVSLTVDGHELSQERLNTLNNPEKGISSPILEQNRQLFIIAPAIGEEAKDFTLPSHSAATNTSVENTPPENIVEKQVLSDLEQARAGAAPASVDENASNTSDSSIPEYLRNPDSPENIVKGWEDASRASSGDGHAKIDMDIPSSDTHAPTDDGSKDDKDDDHSDTDENTATEVHEGEIRDTTPKPEQAPRVDETGAATPTQGTHSDNENASNTAPDKIEALRRGIYLRDSVSAGTVPLDITHDITMNDAREMCSDHVTKISGFENATLGGGGGMSGSVNGHSVYSFSGIYSQSDGNNTNIALVDCDKGITSARYFATSEDGRSHFMMDTQNGPMEMTYAQAKHFVQNVERHSIHVENGHVSHPENKTLREALSTAYPEESRTDKFKHLSGRGEQPAASHSPTQGRPNVHASSGPAPQKVSSGR